MMPTLSKAQLIQPESPWGAAFDRTYLELCQDRVRILTALGFYAEHDQLPLLENPTRFRRKMKKQNCVK
jgi:hypothetical protein